MSQRGPAKPVADRANARPGALALLDRQARKHGVPLADNAAMKTALKAQRWARANKGRTR